MLGVGRTRLRDAVASGDFVVVHRGWYVAGEIWKRWHSESRHAARSLATVRAMRDGGTVASHTSAAALWGLPFYRFEPQRVHVTGPRVNGVARGAHPVVRHEGDIVACRAVVDGVAVTSLARTIADVIGRLPLEASVALADAGLRRVAWRGGDDPYDVAEAERLKAEVRQCSALTAGARGSRQARWVIAFADGRAQRPGESASRVLLHRLGFAPPRLQVRIPLEKGWYDVDFGIDDADVWGEFDGEGKYVDPEMLAGKSTAKVLLEEKRREDDIRGRTRRGIIRWGWHDIAGIGRFRRRLASFHVHPPLKPGDVPPTFAGPPL
ncbi:hypothetical protein [Microbacterium sp. BK668]|uniref:hypothetical protein n=1 Tax=Microbacterium sp. BK668 TaxID=2512118 RepID=UPI00106092EA|nr:hypothetical protein [Microbacterium sp. BK668]TDN90569.1 hypothetical protein EV279_0056 [Microbacterium sp. BK668]